MAAIKSVYWSWVFIAWMLSNLKSNSSFFSSNNPPESRCISLLQRLKKTPTHIAVVLDELEVRSSDIEKAAGTDDGQIDLETIANVHDIISWCAAAQCSVLTLHDPQGESERVVSRLKG